jgi:hypothetical protein
MQLPYMKEADFSGVLAKVASYTHVPVEVVGGLL